MLGYLGPQPGGPPEPPKDPGPHGAQKVRGGVGVMSEPKRPPCFLAALCLWTCAHAWPCF